MADRRHGGRKLPTGVRVETQKDGTPSFRGQYSDHAGKRRTCSFAVLADAAMWAEQGRARAKRIRAGLELPQGQQRAVPTFGELAAALVAEPPPTWSPKHARDVADRLRLHVLPAIGDFPLDAIRRGDVLRIRNTVVRSGLSANTANKVISALSVVMESGLADELIPANPAHGAGIRLALQRQEPETLTAEQAQRLLDHADAAWKPLMAAGILTGARLGELSAARWRDMSLATGEWHLRRSNSRRVTKGRKDRRVTLPDALLPFLRSMVAEMYGDESPPVDYLVFRRANRHRNRSADAPVWCPHADPRTARIRSPRGALKAAATAAELPFVPTFHILRHSHASIALAQCVPVPVVRDQLGHSSILVTNRYAHAHDRASVRSLQLAVAEVSP